MTQRNGQAAAASPRIPGHTSCADPMQAGLHAHDLPGHAPAPCPPPGDACRVGRGEVHSHHGEIVQGLFYSADGELEHGLVTLPCPLFRTRARFRPLRSGPLAVEPGDRSRARTAARLTLDALGRTGWGGSLRIESNIPLRWGCGSSTT